MIRFVQEFSAARVTAGFTELISGLSFGTPRQAAAKKNYRNVPHFGHGWIPIARSRNPGDSNTLDR